VATERQANGQAFLRDSDVDVNYWKKHFQNIYTRILSSAVGYLKAGLIISRKGRIGLQRQSQMTAARGSSSSHPSLP
jgi:hypothetical protein